MQEFALNMVADERQNANGKLAPRVVLEVDGQQRAVQRVTLESDIAIARTAKKWSQQFDIDQAKVVSELQGLGVEVMAEVAERRKRRGTPPDAELRISELADEFLSTLEPQWHRKHRAIYFQGLGREVALGTLWTLANDALIDRVVDTVEAHEAARDAVPPNYRARLALLKEAIAMAGSRLITKLPALADATQDDTLDQQDLLDSLVVWLLAPRTFRTDTGTPVGTTYHGWALALTPGDRWHQCFTAPVFGRISEAHGRPEICVKPEVLRTALNYETTRRLNGDLERSEYAKKTSIKVTGCAWRVLKFDSKVLDAITFQSEVAPDACNP
ncbi:MAG: hypothetical protein IIA66_11175 [Planctomycetes bacterium]|nr:hypothetical protein [Planctomycetota bacterium]